MPFLYEQKRRNFNQLSKTLYAGSTFSCAVSLSQCFAAGDAGTEGEGGKQQDP